MSELVPALKETLFAPTYDLAAEYAEIGLDLLLENDTLKAIPVAPWRWTCRCLSARSGEYVRDCLAARC